MREVEEKSRQPAAELLQDVRSILQRSEEEPCEIPAAFPLELKRRIWDFFDRKPDLEGWRKQFPGVMSECKAANVTLDPDTAHPHLLLSEDHKSVRMDTKCKKCLTI
ncbi:tripartite motif-containing protein 10-like [Varanus komodoensis]|uniref:tripartite motif-containing protein 10-like n=1 Tax=Varanus komodoensis TaxID=61221 RepID=UPI001CF789CB|nr:tripartite motif-containing protein 10-like [Varanus komodoensis]